MDLYYTSANLHLFLLALKGSEEFFVILCVYLFKLNKTTETYLHNMKNINSGKRYNLGMPVLSSIILPLFAFVLLGCNSPKHRSIVILYENDVHCNIDNYALMRGLADAMSDTACVGLTSSGDFLHGGTAGAISGGHFVVDIMKEMDYAAVGLGNHEFDFGVPHLTQLMAESGLPIANMNFCTIDKDSLFFSPYIIKNYDGRKVAFIGVVTPETLLSEAYSFYDKQGNQTHSLCEDNLIAEVQKVVNIVRKEGADYVVLLSHLGEASAKNLLTSHSLISNTRGIDVVLDGHTHSCIPCDTLVDADGRQVLISQTGSKFKRVGKLLISPSGNISTELIPVDSIKVENANVRAVTDSIKVKMSRVTSTKLCHSNYSMDILDVEGRQLVRTCETSIGNMVTDAFRAITGAQIAVNNGGGIRAQLPAGDWTYGNIVDAFPYNNYLMVVKVKGSNLFELLVATTANAPMEDGQFPQLSGLRFTLDVKAVGKDRISNVQIQNEKTGRYVPLDFNAEYTLCTTDYCVTGGGMYNVLRDAEILQENIMLYNQAVVDYVTNQLNGEIPERYAATQGRIIMK